MEDWGMDDATKLMCEWIRDVKYIVGLEWFYPIPKLRIELSKITGALVLDEWESDTAKHSFGSEDELFKQLMLIEDIRDGIEKTFRIMGIPVSIGEETRFVFDGRENERKTD